MSISLYMKHIIFNKPLVKQTHRKELKNIDFDHLEKLQKIKNKEPMDDDMKNILSEIRKKHYAYKSQDKIKHKFDDIQHITLDQLIDKILESNLKCYYCEKELLLIYNKLKDTSQWSLERLDNNKGHYNENTCIACLHCNLSRRTDNYIEFKKGKMLRIVKSEE
jgi:NAD-dependent dihydropyrimidine dehydrogenase PreA subunit